MKATINGITMNFAERGLPQGLPVVFIHGFPFSHEMWDPQMRALPNSIRAVTYDIRGHGRSDVGDGIYSIEFFVDDLLALLDHLVIDKAVMCGLSMGGYIALRAAERAPERVRALVLADTQSSAEADAGKIRRSASIKSVQQDGVKVFAETFAKNVFSEHSLKTKPQSVQFMRRIIEGNSPLGICGTLLALAARTDTTASLSSINIPTLILVGESDALTPPAKAEALHGAIRGSELHVLKNAAHVSNVEAEEEFNERLIVFLKKLL